MVTDKQRNIREKNLKPFKPGQSGNPKERPKKGLALADLIGDNVSLSDRAEIINKHKELAKKGNSWSTEFIFTRLYGKVPDQIITGEREIDEVVIE